MAFLTFMIILHLYSDPCFGQPTMDDADAGMRCSKCIVGTKAREYICSDCTRGGDNADKPFTCRRCDIGASSAQPFLCRRCINTNTNADINSWSDGLTTTTAPSTGDNASREQRLAELRRTLNCRRGYSADFIDEVIEKKYSDGNIQRINARIQEDLRKFPELHCNENNNLQVMLAISR